jgi:hypothetical protein
MGSGKATDVRTGQFGFEFWARAIPSAGYARRLWPDVSLRYNQLCRNAIRIKPSRQAVFATQKAQISDNIYLKLTANKNTGIRL